MEHEKELFLVAQEVVSLSNGYLRYEPESVYIKSAEIEKYWLQEIPNDKDGHVKRSSIAFDYGGFNSLETILKEFGNDGLTHIIVDQNENRPNFLKNIFENEENYPYLIKEYDSKNDKLNYNVKIFRIDYDSFNKLKFD